MISDLELMELFDKKAGEFKGQTDDLAAIYGLIIFGRLFGWRVARLVLPRRTWTKAVKEFGDIKELMPELGLYYKRSLGYEIVEKMGKYWDYVKGVTKQISLDEKRKLKNLDIDH